VRAATDITAAEVAAVATFYTMYKRRPGGDYNVGVCTNTLCAVLGGDEIFARLKEHLGIGHDETTEDRRVTLEHLECNAACDYAPVMMVNWEFFDNQTPQSAVELVEDLRAGRTVTPDPRGPRCAPSRRSPACWQASPTAAPTRAPPPDQRRWPGWRSTASSRPPVGGAGRPRPTGRPLQDEDGTR
jgi:NADH-quinone oxidoreductase subunit E